ncbi:class I SAM-dependent methyltransferase [Flavobacterium cerinum]|uniref:Methyltransferase domain-containing protein n=1 Tax=Flavobacterium cerinum TaxID=2502784 RepID=A0A444HCM5_9FLAO|nr:class I SAM-dependent methyltransferase [Flavobacterium cerinum]RWX01525.1 methyltransferase domain-containing protein [Flavobacterium cerinum]
MKLTETELRELAKQLRCPDGESGIKVGEMMNFTNSNIINKAIESIKLENGDRILEIGPGNGSHVKDIINSVTDLEYFGIDISETMVEEAEKLNTAYENVSFRLTDGEHIPFSENHFNKIFTCNTIYFWNDPQDYVHELSRVLKPDGIVSIGFIPKSTMQHIPFAKFGFVLYDVETVIQLLENVGFTILEANVEKELVTSNSGEKIEREFIILSAKKS